MTAAQITDALKLKQRIYIWSFVIVFTLLCVWMFQSSLLPFVLGALIGYLLDPFVDYCEKFKCPRWLASVTILIVFYGAIVGTFFLTLPFLHRELINLAKNMPEYADKLWMMSEPLRQWADQYLDESDIENFRKSIQGNADKLAIIGTNIAGTLASSGQAIIGLLSVFFITPLVAFFMMKEWDIMTKWVDDLIPRDDYDTIKSLLTEINAKVSGFIRGQLTVAFILAVIYALALTIAKLNYGFIIGFSAGVLSIIPLLGSSFGLIASVGVAWLQSGEISYTAIIAAIFITGQIIEGNVLTPKLLGKSVGLHPLWILFSLMVGGSAFGILGMLIAVPIAASAGVLISFALKQYKQSPYYTGAHTAAPKSAPKTTAKKATTKKKTTTNKAPAKKTATKKTATKKNSKK